MTRKLYWENPYLYESEASIIKKEKKNNMVHIILDKSIFYPDGSGGQPGDIGTINGKKVVETIEVNDNLVHILKSDVSETSGTKVQMSIDPSHRFDMMQQHTGQHLLSGVISTLLEGETISFHLGKDYSTIDVTLPAIDDDEIEKVEILCNKIIQSNFDVKSYFVDSDKIKLIPVRKSPNLVDDIRIIEIDEFDYSPCGGTHLSHTGELGLLKITKWEHYKGNIRIQFISGNRAVKDYTSKFQSVRTIAGFFSSTDDGIEYKVNRLIKNMEYLEKEFRNRKNELIQVRSEQLVNDSQKIENISIINKLYEEYDFKELSQLGSHISTNYKKTVQIFGISNVDVSQFIISKSKDVNIDLTTIYKTLSSEFKIKGGGNTNTIQGSVPTEALVSLMNKSLDIIVDEIKLNIGE